MPEIREELRRQLDMDTFERLYDFGSEHDALPGSEMLLSPDWLKIVSDLRMDPRIVALLMVGMDLLHIEHDQWVSYLFRMWMLSLALPHIKDETLVADGVLSRELIRAAAVCPLGKSGTVPRLDLEELGKIARSMKPTVH